MLDYDSIFIIHFINCITVGPVKQAPAIYISNMKGYLYRSSAEYRIDFVYWEMCAYFPLCPGNQHFKFDI